MTTVRRDLIGLAFVAALLFVPWLGARDLWNPNEPLYGQAVTEMAARGDWRVPPVTGPVFDEKPVPSVKAFKAELKRAGERRLSLKHKAQTRLVKIVVPESD